MVRKSLYLKDYLEDIWFELIDILLIYHHLNICVPINQFYNKALTFHEVWNVIYMHWNTYGITLMANHENKSCPRGIPEDTISSSSSISIWPQHLYLSQMMGQQQPLFSCAEAWELNINISVYYMVCIICFPLIATSVAMTWWFLVEIFEKNIIFWVLINIDLLKNKLLQTERVLICFFINIKLIEWFTVGPTWYRKCIFDMPAKTLL